MTYILLSASPSGALRLLPTLPLGLESGRGSDGDEGRGANGYIYEGMGLEVRRSTPFLGGGMRWGPPSHCER